MKNTDLAYDYVDRAGKRLRAVETLLELEAWADVVRESQEVVELAMKGLLRFAGVEPPRLHDVSDLVGEHRAAYPRALQKKLARMAAISRGLRRDRELAFYGSEDLTPSQFYKESDAREAIEGARFVVGAAGTLFRDGDVEG